MVSKGLVLPNRNWDLYTADELKALHDLAPSTIVVLTYDSPIDASHATQLEPYLQTNPGTWVILRPYNDNTVGINPALTWVLTCHRAVDLWHGHAQNVSLLPANEIDIEATTGSWVLPDGKPDYDMQVGWLNMFATLFRSLDNSTALHLPALSPNNRNQLIIGMSKYASLKDHYDIVDFHGYTLDQITAGAAILKEYFPGKPTCLSEWNQCDPASVFSLDIEAVSRCYFLLGGTPDQAQYDITKQPTEYASYKSWPEVMPVPEPAPLPVSPGERMMIAGIDVSDNNGSENWALVASGGNQFAVIKATEGVGYTNPLFASARTGAKSAGLITGFYHFARPDQTNPKDEVDYFLAAIGNLGVGDFLALDIEVGRGPLQAWSTVFLQYLESKVGFKPWLYSGRWFMEPHQLHDNTDLNKYGLWLADYDTSKYPTPEPAWDFVACWQYGQGAVPGIAGPVDLNLFNGTREQLLKYGKQS